jgi:VIT1/CCC1 family predicted Fe2+/Mn2+ transporter
MTTVHVDTHADSSNARRNALRAAVLGANDGIVSVAGIVVGVAGATSSKGVILAAGLAGLVAGALSMAAGEYVSVSTQRDTEQALLAKEREELRDFPEAELEELAMLYQAKGLSPKTATLVAKELTAHDAFAAHAEAELRLNPNDLNNPWHAALASAASFFIGAVIPLITIMVTPSNLSVIITFASVLVALTLTGYLSALVGDAKKGRAIVRVVVGGAIAMAVTYGIGHLVGVSRL